METKTFIDIPQDFLCPITQEMMENPVVAADGHSYEKAAIVTWLQTGKMKSPLTGLEFEDQRLIDNHTLKKVIEEFKKEKMPFTKGTIEISTHDLESQTRLKGSIMSLIKRRIGAITAGLALYGSLTLWPAFETLLGGTEDPVRTWIYRTSIITCIIPLAWIITILLMKKYGTNDKRCGVWLFSFILFLICGYSLLTGPNRILLEYEFRGVWLTILSWIEAFLSLRGCWFMFLYTYTAQIRDDAVNEFFNDLNTAIDF